MKVIVIASLIGIGSGLIAQNIGQFFGIMALAWGIILSEGGSQ